MPAVPPGLVLLRLLAGLCALLLSAAGAHAQPAPALGSAANEVEIAAEFFGVGNIVRPGDWAGIRLAITDRGERPRSAAVRMHVRDPDGDDAAHQRIIALTPGRTSSIWLYPHLPYSTSPDSVFTVTVHAVDSEGDEESAVALGRQLGATRIAPARNGVPEPPSASLIGVVGRQRIALDQYSYRHTITRLSATSHEVTDIVADLKPETLPDAWMGLAALEALVWVEGQPGALSEESAEALREWVYRGGHLVVVLPGVGQAWTNPRNPLLDLMPAATIERREGVDLDQYRPILTASETRTLPDNAPIHVFRASPGAATADAAPIIAGADGAAVVMRRIAGAGAVTVIGIDLANPRLLGVVDAQALWHRVLGRRGDILTEKELEAEQARSAGSFLNFQRDPTNLDADVTSMINETAEAGVGVLLALVVFTAYLVLAGPGGFALLRARSWKQHAWVAFVGTTAVFTLIAWGGATALRPQKTRIRHLTLIDHVYGQPVERARTWFSALLPTYGEQTVSIGDPAQPSPWRNALTAWDESRQGGPTTFPDSREYIVNTIRPDSLTVPTRSTVKQFQADWLGGPPWRMPTPLDGSPLRIAPSGRLEGVVSHGLPAPLRDVEIVFVQKQKPYAALGLGGPLFAQTLAWRLADPWAPGQSLDLGALGPADSGERFFADYADRRRLTRDNLTGALSPDSAPARFSMLAWLPVLEPPRWRSQSMDGSRQSLQRRATHGWDLGKWFTQPCVIIVGHVVDAPPPTPLRVDGSPASATGRTVVRWVYPLPPNPAQPTPESEEPT